MGFCLCGPSAIEFWRHYDNCIPGMCVFGHTLGAGPMLPEAFPSNRLRPLRRLSGLVVDEDVLASLDRRLLGLDEASPIHVLVHRSGRRQLSKVVVHTVSSELPAGSLLVVEPGMCVVSPEYAILQAAACCTEVDLLLLIQEFCGCYSIQSSRDGLFMRHPLTSIERIKHFISNARNLKGLRKVQKMIAYAADGSGSPRETAVALLMHLPKRYGGFGFPRACLNLSVDLGECGAILWGKRNAFDLVWEDARVIVEYDGRGSHATTAQRDRDNARRNAAVAKGYVVYVLTDERLCNVEHVHAIAVAAAKALGFRLVIQREDFREKHLLLRKALGI